MCNSREIWSSSALELRTPILVFKPMSAAKRQKSAATAIALAMSLGCARNAPVLTLVMATLKQRMSGSTTLSKAMSLMLQIAMSGSGKALMLFAIFVVSDSSTPKTEKSLLPVHSPRVVPMDQRGSQESMSPTTWF